MILILCGLLGAFVIATYAVPVAFAGSDTHKFQGPAGGKCTRPGCGKPYASSVHHEQRPDSVR